MLVGAFPSIFAICFAIQWFAIPISATCGNGASMLQCCRKVAPATDLVVSLTLMQAGIHPSSPTEIFGLACTGVDAKTSACLPDETGFISTLVACNDLNSFGTIGIDCGPVLSIGS